MPETLTLRQWAAATGRSAATAKMYAKEPGFPEPVAPGRGRSPGLYRAEDLAGWLAKRMLDRPRPAWCWPLLAAVASGVPVRKACVDIGVHNTNVYTYARRHQDFAADLDLARQGLIRAALALHVPVGRKEIADRLGVKETTVQQWRSRGVLPDPEPSTVGGRPWWRWADVERWAIETGRLDDPKEQPMETVTNAAGVSYLDDGLVPEATATAACCLCGRGIYQAGADDENRPLWRHVNGYRTCDEADDLAAATPF